MSKGNIITIIIVAAIVLLGVAYIQQSNTIKNSPMLDDTNSVTLEDLKSSDTSEYQPDKLIELTNSPEQGSKVVAKGKVTQKTSPSRISILDITLTDKDISENTKSWKSTNIKNGGSFISPPDWTLANIWDDGSLWKVTKPEGRSTIDFIAVGDKSLMKDFFGEPKYCAGGDSELGTCVYGNDAETEHLAKIMTWF
jgi:hypothetical protein